MGGLQIVWFLAGAVAQEAAFEVASVKAVQSLPGRAQSARDMLWEMLPPGNFPVRGRTLRIESIGLPQLIAMAYEVRMAQLSSSKDLPDGRFLVEAIIPEGTSSEETGEMLRNLLAERFGMKVHREVRSISGLHLVARPGVRVLKPADSSAGDNDTSVEDLVGAKRERLPRGAASFRSKRCTMAHLADYLQNTLKLPVGDRTGFEGRYAVEVKVEPPAEGSDGLDIVARWADALRSIGLDLKKGPVSMNMVVVDSVSKTPTAN